MGVTINTDGFDINFASSIDKRLIVDRADGITSSLVSLEPNYNYTNMYVWVREEKSFYYLIDSPAEDGATFSDWTKLSIGGPGATGCGKSGYVSGASFSTTISPVPATASVVFDTPYSSASYSVAVTSHAFDGVDYLYSVIDKTENGFTIRTPTEGPIGATAMWIANCFDGSGLSSGGGGNILLQTNTITNDNQNILNLIEGGYISISDDGAGNITIDDTAAAAAIALVTAIDLSEVAFGTGTSIISNDAFTFDNTDLNLIVSKNASVSSNRQSAIITGQQNSIENSDASIITGSFNKIYDSYKSAIISGGGNAIGTQSGGEKAISIDRNNANVIIGGSSNEITGVYSCQSSIIGGASSSISESKRSVILGGFGLTLSNENSVVYVPKLKIATASNDESATKVLVWGVDNYVGYKDASVLGGGTPPLPIPKINLMQGTQSVQVYQSSDNTISGTYAIIHNYPVLINMDFTSDHFSNPDNKIFIEMVYYRRKSRKTVPFGDGVSPGIKKKKGKSYVVPAKNLADFGQDTDLPWIAAALAVGATGSWSRSGSQYWMDAPTFPTPQLIAIDRPNHVEVTGYTISSYPIWQYLNGRFEFYDVAYRSATSPTQSTIQFLNTLIPNSGKSKVGRNVPTGRFPYSPYYTPYYCAFRYIQWIPNVHPRPSGGGYYGQIVSGPLSKVIKVTGLKFPFEIDYLKSATQLSLGIPSPVPVCDINPSSLTFYNRLKCDWESNLP